MNQHFPTSFDVTIVGAGISGLVLGRLLSGSGLSVAILEQRYSMPRNQRFAGIVSVGDLKTLGILDPEHMPIQNYVREIVSIDCGKTAIGQGTARVSGDARTVVHADLLLALRRDCGERGIAFLEDATVSGLIWTDGTVRGVIAGPDHQEIRSRIAVLADESDPRLAEGPGLRPDWMPVQLAHVAKERFDGSSGSIHDRFGGGSNGIDCFHLISTTSWGDPAEAFIMPAGTSVTVGVSYLLEHEMVSARHVLDVLEEIKGFPDVKALLNGFEVSGFVTEVVPVGTGAEPQRMVDDGILLAGDVVGATNPLNRDGLSDNLAVCEHAARAIVEALRANDASAAGLSSYQQFLDSALYHQKRRRFRLQVSPGDASADESTPLEGLIRRRLATVGVVTSGQKSETLGHRSRRQAARVIGSIRKSTKRQAGT